MDGHHATRQIRTAECEGQGPRRPHRRLLITAHSETEAFVKSYEAGCTAHVTKPLSKAGLIETIRRYAIGSPTPLTRHDGCPAGPTNDDPRRLHNRA